MLYVIYGSDPLARRESFGKLKAELDRDGSLATNSATFDARQTTPQEVMAACDTVPFLGDRRLVVVEGLLQQGSRVKKGRKRAPSRAAKPEADDSADDGGPWATLAGYVPRMPETTTLVLLDDEVPASNGLLMAIGPLGKVEHCTLPSEKALPSWVTQRAKKMGLKIDARAASVLAELIGPDPMTLSSELEKLLVYSGGDVVREADVRELVSRAKEHKGWELADAVLDGQGSKAARVLNELLEDGAVAAVLLSTVAGRYPAHRHRPRHARPRRAGHGDRAAPCFEDGFWLRQADRPGATYALRRHPRRLRPPDPGRARPQARLDGRAPGDRAGRAGAGLAARCGSVALTCLAEKEWGSG